jgi:hypothetical protein
VSGALWPDHPATPRQQRLMRPTGKRAQPTQANLLIQMRRDARTRGVALELPTIMQAGIAQHGARLNELRRHGFVIQNELAHDSSGVVRSRYWLKFDPERDGGHAG